jgi:hypothetical protein
MLDPRASAHPVSDQAELLIFFAAALLRGPCLETTRHVCLRTADADKVM